jgi:hypothetical protein
LSWLFPVFWLALKIENANLFCPTGRNCLQLERLGGAVIARLTQSANQSDFNCQKMLPIDIWALLQL